MSIAAAKAALETMPLPAELEHLRAKWLLELQPAPSAKRDALRLMKLRHAAEDAAILQLQQAAAAVPNGPATMDRVHKFEFGSFDVSPALHQQYLKERAEGEPEVSCSPCMHRVHPVLGF